LSSKQEARRSVVERDRRELACSTHPVGETWVTKRSSKTPSRVCVRDGRTRRFERSLCTQLERQRSTESRPNFSPVLTGRCSSQRGVTVRSPSAQPGR